MPNLEADKPGLGYDNTASCATRGPCSETGRIWGSLQIWIKRCCRDGQRRRGYQGGLGVEQLQAVSLIYGMLL